MVPAVKGPGSWPDLAAEAWAALTGGAARRLISQVR
jgi:hypothetical protein